MLDAGLPVRSVNPGKLRQFAKAALRRVRQAHIRRIEADLVHLDQRIAQAIAATAMLARQRNEKTVAHPTLIAPEGRGR